MSILVLLLASRKRLRSQNVGSAESEGSPSADQEFTYALTHDGLTISAEGHCAPAQLPKAETVIAVLADADVSWHRIVLPKAPAARMRAALAGVLEDALLDDEANTHLALAPEAVPGQESWVAAVNKPWLAAELKTLEEANVIVERVVPSSWPDDPPSAHFYCVEEELGARTDNLALAWSDPQGVACIRLSGGMARSLLPADPDTALRASATPAAAAAAERWLGSPVAVLPTLHRALLAERSLWNVRQFDLAAKHRGTRALTDAWRRLQSPPWRPVRVGLVALCVLQIVGLNLWAWELRAQEKSRQREMEALLRSSFPQVRYVQDAAVQMKKEADALRTAAGRPGDGDFETLLQVAANAWPDAQPPTDKLRFEPGRLALAATGWTPAQIDRFRDELRVAGWRVEAADGQINLSRASTGSP